MRAHCLTRLYASMTRNRLTAGEVEAARHYLALGLAMSERHGHCATCHALLYPAAVSVHIAQGALPKDVFSGAPQHSNAAKFGTLGVTIRARKAARA